MPYATDFITYSEGANDDVNKFVWSGLGWDPKIDVLQILREYSRYFIGERYTDPFAQGLLGLERNWRGPLAVERLGLHHARAVPGHGAERGAARPAQLAVSAGALPGVLRRLRQRRLLSETAIEARALDRLRGLRTGESQRALADAGTILDEARDKPAPEWRQRVYTLAEALFQTIRQQLSVERYGAIAVGRGATLDSLETPLNNAGWLRPRFAEAAALDKEEDRLAAIDRILRWTDPGPGGYYDDLGNPSLQPHLVAGLPFAEDPQRFKSTLVGFGYRPDWRLSWMTHAESFWETPLRLRYTDLDPSARYRVRVLYAGDVFSMDTLIRLVADDTYEIHPPTRKPSPLQPLEFDIPAGATRDGALTLTFTGPAGVGSAGRGVQVAEVWLMRKD